MVIADSEYDPPPAQGGTTPPKFLRGPVPQGTPQVLAGYQTVRQLLLDELTPAGHWEGELSVSALATATAVMTLQMVRKSGSSISEAGDAALIERGLHWLAAHQNSDGGWGDTTVSFSNISTTMLAHAVFHATGAVEQYFSVVTVAKSYLEQAGGVAAVKARYGKDHTFSVPILTMCALAGLVDWREISPLPFELACVPARFYKTVRLPVVSYALPALIAIGQARFHFRAPRNPVLWGLRKLAVEPSLRILEQIQPTSGGFLEATPLTSFVTMSLAGIGRAEHPVVRRGLEFLRASVRADGSWPIDTNLATWVTTLAVNGLEGDLPRDAAVTVLEWLLGQQYKTVHPYTQAEPGAWAWTDLSGGVPDADDTPGAILACLTLAQRDDLPRELREQVPGAVQNAICWLLDLQNHDGGWPTFCRGWANLPFDRSSCDITAHALRAIVGWQQVRHKWPTSPALPVVRETRITKAIAAGYRYLARQQLADGSWLPLWFGNQYHPREENPTYGTSRVLLAYQGSEVQDREEYWRGVRWLVDQQQSDGSWSAGRDLPPSVEETALAVAALAREPATQSHAERGLNWLTGQIRAGTIAHASPIGFYFAKLWYSEKLYPLVYAASAFRRMLPPDDQSSARMV